MLKRIDQIGHSVGIHFKSEAKIGSTRDAHRLIYLSQSNKGFLKSKIYWWLLKLFEAYHELEKDTPCTDVLRELATDAGLNGSEVEEWLISDLGGGKKCRYGSLEEPR